MIDRPHHIFPLIGFVATLAVGPVAPEAGNIMFLTVGVVSYVLMWPSAMRLAHRPIAWMPVAGLALLAIAYIASGGFHGLVGLIYFAPLFVILPLTTLLLDVDVRQYGANLSVLALCGASAAAIMAIQDVQMTGTTRAGEQIANPIHFADVALLVGFIALIGMAFFRSFWRLVFLIAPIMSIIAVTLSGTRGAVVAAAAMLLVAVTSAAAVRLISMRFAIFGFIALLGAGVIFLAMGGSQVSGIQRVIADISDTLNNGAPTDDSTSARLQMYLGGLRAFLESPVYGHGTMAFVGVANNYADTPFGDSPHLHNDIIDMAAGGGVLGLVAYLLFLSAPIAEALRAPQSTIRPWTIVLTITIVGGFFVMGLTNAMFGILTVTTTFAAICVIVGMLASPTAIPEPTERSDQWT